jgi:hypothetical protein
MKIIFIAGSWGSGTTSVIGALNSLGAPTLGPFFESNDPKTLNTFELIPFRNLILQYVDEPTIKYKDNYSTDFVPALKRFKKELKKHAWPGNPDSKDKILVLKTPLASICLPEICSVFDTKIIVVHRPFEEIEASRIRRNWHTLYGSLGAQHIYNKIFSDTIKYKLSFLGISYSDFVNNTEQSLKNISDYCDLESNHNNLENAAAFVRAPQ